MGNVHSIASPSVFPGRLPGESIEDWGVRQIVTAVSDRAARLCQQFESQMERSRVSQEDADKPAPDHVSYTRCK